MISTRSARFSAFESSSAQIGCRLPVRALISTTGELLARPRCRFVSGGSLLRFRAAGVSSPGTFVSIALPGLNPSARFMSVGAIGLPFLLRGMADFVRWSRSPVSVLLSRFVKRLFGHGNWHTAGSVKSHPGLTSTPAIRFAEAPAGMSSSSVSAAAGGRESPLHDGDPTSGPRATLAGMDLAAADRTYLWHPFTQQRGWVAGGAADDRARRGHRPDRRRRATATSTASRRSGATSTATATRRSTRRCATSSTGSPTRRCSASPTPARPSWPRAWSRSRRPGLDARLLLRLRLDRGRDRAEDGLPVLAASAAASTRAHARSSACATAYHGDTIGSVSVGGIDLFHCDLPARCCSTRSRAEPGDAADMERAARRARRASSRP